MLRRANNLDFATNAQLETIITNIVYSVGPDHQDNGGPIDPPGKGPRPKEMDIGFWVERTVEK